jgi:hypothetical protein
MLREMRDAAGDSGEFYTPHPIVRFMLIGMLDMPLGAMLPTPHPILSGRQAIGEWAWLKSLTSLKTSLRGGK